MPADMTALLDDLRAEHDDLAAVAEALDWSTPTPAAGWTVGDTIGHLWYFDRTATTALLDPDRFTAELQTVIADPDGYVGRTEAEWRALGTDLPRQWRETQRGLLQALADADPATKVPWYGPPMSPASFATARLMEYWAHGQDVADAAGVTRTPTDRLRHICHLGVRTRGFSFVVRGLEAPTADVHVVLTSPTGAPWTWGDAAATDRVEGSALDFCLVVTQRRLAADTALVATGPVATQWLAIAQAFAGTPTTTDAARADLPVR
jgi:uncharacterized protein (TIGR03084 family)